MIPLALSFFIGLFWIIGILIGIGALIAGATLLISIEASANRIDADARDAYGAEMMSGGVKGVDGLSETNNLAGQVPGLATSYLGKVQRGGRQ